MKYNGPERYEVLNSILRTNETLVLNTGAEIGVRSADTSEFLLHNNKSLVLLLVDPYTAYLDVGDYKFEEQEQSALKEASAIKLSRFKKRAQWIYKPSVEAAKQVEEGSLDFVFIDANHEEAHVREDIYAWFPKVRSGGLVTGHDYSMEGVNKVVKEWAAKFGKTIFSSDIYSDVWALEI